MLTKEMPIEWIADQAGTSSKMIRRRYGKWIPGDSDDMINRAERRLGFIWSKITGKRTTKKAARVPNWFHSGHFLII
ncbi:MAG: hypothetical protein ABW153_16800 [Sedimenticola sp.]